MFAWGNLKQWIIFTGPNFLEYTAETNCDPCDIPVYKNSGASTYLRFQSSLTKDPMMSVVSSDDTTSYVYLEGSAETNIEFLPTEVSQGMNVWVDC